MAILAGPGDYLKSAKLIALAVVVVAILGAFGYLRIQLTIAQAKAETATAKADQWQAEVKRQAKEVDRLNQQAKALLQANAAADQVLQKATQENNKLRGTVQQLLGNYEKLVRLKPRESCTRQPVDGDVIQWMRDATSAVR